MKRLAWFTLIVLATLTTAILFWEFRVAVVLFILPMAARRLAAWTGAAVHLRAVCRRRHCAGGDSERTLGG